MQYSFCYLFLTPYLHFPTCLSFIGEDSFKGASKRIKGSCSWCKCFWTGMTSFWWRKCNRNNFPLNCLFTLSQCVCFCLDQEANSFSKTLLLIWLLVCSFLGIWVKFKADSEIGWKRSSVLQKKEAYRFWLGFHNLNIEVILAEPHNCIVFK